jgi:NitT/TauT family transport system substrate-binding protein
LRLKPVTCLLLLAAACGRGRPPEIRIGINPWPGYEFLWLAAHVGLFDSTAVQIRAVEFNSLSDARRAFERGQVEGFTSTTIEVLEARDNGTRRPEIVYVTDYSNGADVLIGGSGIRRVPDLRGRKIGAEFGSLNLYLLARALEKERMTLADVTPVSVELLDMPEAFKSHGVDAVATYPPASLDILRRPESKVLFSSAEIPGEIIDVVSLDSQVIAAHPEVVGIIARGFDAGRRYAEQHPVEAYELMARREHISVEEFRSTLNGGIQTLSLEKQGPYFGGPTRLAAILRRSADLLHSIGEIREAPDADRAFVPAIAAPGR